MIIITPSC